MTKKRKEVQKKHGENTPSQWKVLLPAIGAMGLLALVAFAIHARRNKVELPHADGAAVPRNGPRMVNVGGVERRQRDPRAVAAMAPQQEQIEQFIAKVNARNNDPNKEPIEPPNKPLRKGMSANIDSVIEAYQSGENPERISPMFVPKPFDLASYQRNPQAYVDVLEPGRAWQSLPPGPDVKSIGTNQEVHKMKPKESVRLRARAVPKAPVTFTSTDLGAFENDLASITVIAGEDGWASAVLTATPGTEGDVNVSAASPMTSGRLVFRVRVSEPTE